MVKIGKIVERILNINIRKVEIPRISVVFYDYFEWWEVKTFFET